MNKYEYFADDDDGHDFAGTSDLAGIELAKRRAMEDLTFGELTLMMKKSHSPLNLRPKAS